MTNFSACVFDIDTRGLDAIGSGFMLCAVVKPIGGRATVLRIDEIAGCKPGNERRLRIRLVTNDAFRIEDGSLYPALRRLERRGWIDSEWGTSDHGRRARFYSLTPLGRQQLAVLAGEWERYVAALDRAIRYGNPRGLWARRPEP